MQRSKKVLMEHYDSSTLTYDRLYGDEQKAKHMRGLQMTPSVNGSMVLDAGCGSGLLLERLNDLAKLVVGLDFSRRMLKIAESRLSKERGELLVGDVENMPFKDKAFDRVFMFTVLQNTPKPLEALKEARRILRDDGYIVVSFLKKVFTKTDVENLLEKCMFKVESHSCVGITDHIYVCSKKPFYPTSL